MKEDRRKKRESKMPTRQTYIPPSQRKSKMAPPRYLGRTVFEMEVEYAENKFARLKQILSRILMKQTMMGMTKWGN